ncbi:Glycine receptor subunit beta [Fasciola hepatica]|uniref:Glycine receptor subunit beta n=1 Tax=Fasciola hepatica TaxID=6192 RepID=A0A2H1CRP9_FASHE|nr:Glycine receptor subunit beta [Fasciola hepatica]
MIRPYFVFTIHFLCIRGQLQDPVTYPTAPKASQHTFYRPAHPSDPAAYRQLNPVGSGGRSTAPRVALPSAQHPPAQPTQQQQQSGIYHPDSGLPAGVTFGDPELNQQLHHQVPPNGGYEMPYIPRPLPPSSQPLSEANSDPSTIPNRTVVSQKPERKSGAKSAMRDQIVSLIMDKYRSYERPPTGANATHVTVFMKILAIFSIDVRTMDYYVDMLLRQTWKDRRLSWIEVPAFQNYTETLVSPKLKEQLWLPDLFFRNGKDGYLHKLTLPNYLLRVAPSGEVLYSQKITMRFSCQMHLQTFPMDTQKCMINIGSYGYTVSELKFLWRAEDPVELADALQLSEFETPKSFKTEDCSGNYSTSTGAYACLQAWFYLQRQLGSYLATTYIPNILIIMVSWLSFWVNVDSAPARVPLGLLSLLGILTQAISVSSTLPRVSYIKAIDVWMMFSIIFVIGVLVEYAVALTVLRKKQAETWHEDVKMIVHEELTRWCAVCQQQQLAQLQNSQGLTRGQLEFCEEMELLLTRQLINDRKEKTKPRRPPGLVESDIDNYSRFLFPACYILYNCFYWAYYLGLKHSP